jgi:hypothetical protein
VRLLRPDKSVRDGIGKNTLLAMTELFGNCITKKHRLELC